MKQPFIIASALLIASAASSFAAPFAFQNGDLILGFQAIAGTGASQNVFVDLGSAVSLRDNGNAGQLANIGTTLTTVFGSNWYSRTDLYFGVIGNLNFGRETAGFGYQAPVNGDPSRTIYISQPAVSAGSAQIIPAAAYSTNALGVAGNNLAGMENMLVTLTAQANGSAILDQTSQSIEWQNGWTTWNPSSGAAFNTFDGGIQQNFGKAGSATYVDIQRVLPSNTGAVPAGVAGGGTYESTISISSTGVITASSAAPVSAYDTWIATFPSITTPANKLSSADPDGDGATNLQEFGFGGDPSNGTDRGTLLTQTVDANNDTFKDITLTIEVRSGASFTSSGNDLVAGPTDELSYRIQGSTNLVDWNSQVSEVTPHLGTGSPSTGYQFKTFRLNAGNGLSGKGFLRATVVK
ncbi:MAG: hypothetical protein ABIS50_02700 [Luteolibacter sp.]|uniref:hypothetical protein n=1 Tax=Luteolibacter sp. TaxID=1962973 RepID=UPI003264CDE8